MDQTFNNEFGENLREEYSFFSEETTPPNINDDIWESGEDGETGDFLEIEQPEEKVEVELGDKPKKETKLSLVNQLIEALDADNAKEFFKHLNYSLNQETQQATSEQQDTVAGLKSLLIHLKQYVEKAFDESEALNDLAPQLAQENSQLILTVLGAIAARSLIKPWLGTSTLDNDTKEQLIERTTQAAKMLRDLSPTALKAFPKIIQTVSQTALRRRLSLDALPKALHNTVLQVVQQPSLVRQLTQLKRPTANPERKRYERNLPQRLILKGPIEIIILSH